MATSPPQRTAQAPRPGDILVVIHDFNARSSDELTLRKSERVELIELDEGFGDGWYLGRHLGRGGTGLFPGVYTTKAPTATRPAHVQHAKVPSYTRQSTSSNATTAVGQDDSTSAYPHPAPPQYAENDPQATQAYVRPYEAPRTSLPSSFTPFVSRSIGEALSSGEPGREDSPVMNETLSVIDEHITDLSTPRQSLAPSRPIKEDSESDYSSHLDRHSYVAGPETDDEENDRPSETQVRQWDHKQMADHLRSIGLEPAHCDIFEEQEISGEVLLDMDQSFIYMKEYSFGVMGRRLKTWHKIRDFQNEVKGRVGKRSRQGDASRRSTYSNVERDSSAEDMGRSSGRMAPGGTILPRIPSLLEKPGLNIRSAQPQTAIHEEVTDTPAPLQPGHARASFGGNTPPSPWRSSLVGDGSLRPSAAMVRQLTHSRRHSSVDHSQKPGLEILTNAAAPSPAMHGQQGSVDRGWSTNSGTSSANATPALAQTRIEPKQDHLDLATSPQSMTPISTDLDRGYFSGNEVENRKHRSILRKRESTGSTTHSRQSSTNASAFKRHSRLPSLDSLGVSSKTPAAKTYHTSSYKGRFRSSSARGSSSPALPGGTTPPTVTNLEESTSPRTLSGLSSTTLASMQSKARKMVGLRAASDNLSHSEKHASSRLEGSLDGSTKASPLASPTGSTTPSQASHSLDIDSTDPARKAGEMASFAALPRAAARARAKGKQETSAYTRGLLKITPDEARKTCDYHGWMKKKSSNLMTTWKPRLFILRGRRLSYYYSENDTEERGIIDISGHKVLVANNDAMITLHAQITGATSPALEQTATEASPNTHNTTSNNYASTIPFYYKRVGSDSGPTLPTSTPFYFKLVPPKSGLSRAVQFTKPAVHYFQCDSIADGRKWMGELMKATIEHDWTTLETTNKQKTISLAKAKARGERPSALLGDPIVKDEQEISTENKENVESGGLNISGLDMKPVENNLSLVGEAEREGEEGKEKEKEKENSSSEAPENVVSPEVPITTGT